MGVLQFLSQKGSRVGRGVKEKQVSLVDNSGGTLNDANPPKEAVSPSVSDEPVAMEMQSLMVDKSYAMDSDKLNIHTLFTPVGNGIDVVLSVESIRTISDRFANLAYGFFLGNRVAYPVVANYVKNTW
ncbi:hypothetical protein Tco_0234676, partial [Tanacetum coccineum]